MEKEYIEAYVNMLMASTMVEEDNVKLELERIIEKHVSTEDHAEIYANFIKAMLNDEGMSEGGLSLYDFLEFESLKTFKNLEHFLKKFIEVVVELKLEDNAVSMALRLSEDLKKTKLSTTVDKVTKYFVEKYPKEYAEAGVDGGKFDEYSGFSKATKDKFARKSELKESFSAEDIANYHLD